MTSMGFGEMDIFIKLGDTVQDVRKTIEQDFGISPEAGLPGKNVISRVISTWETAHDRGVKRRAEDAEQRATDQPRRLPKSTHLQLIRTYNENHEKLDDEGTPAQSYVEWIIQTVEDGEQEVERLKNVVSKPEVNDEPWGMPYVTQGGGLRFTRGKKSEVDPPMTTEMFRYRNTLQATAWELARLNSPTQPIFTGLDEAVWRKHVEFVLGKKVAGATATTQSGMTYKLSWAIVMELECQLRKLAMGG